VLGATLDATWGIAAGFGRAWFIKPERIGLLNRLSGVVLIGGGIWLSLLKRSV
jgi:homoserine/homoserine lactone efflux protein